MYTLGMGNPTLTSATFYANAASAEGGAMYNHDSSPVLTNVTFHNNSAASQGGGIYNFHSHPIFKNLTIRGNVAVSGGGLYDFDSNLQLMNSIVWGNTGGEISNEYSVLEVSHSIVQGGYFGTANLDVDPLLGPLQNNGGFTKTMSLGIGSPAIDAGDDVNCPGTDQRGVRRPQGSHCDMGAYEFGPIP